VSEITVTVDSRHVRAMLNGAPGRMTRAMRAAATDAATLLKAIMRDYPPKRNSQRYVRTDTLKGSWDYTVTGSGLEVVARITSNGQVAPYNRLVQDRTMQARVHRGRWQTAQGVAVQNAGRVQSFFDRRLRDEFR